MRNASSPERTGTRGFAVLDRAGRPDRRPLLDALTEAVSRARASGQRIQPVDLGGQRFWIKIARGKPWTVQISKGDPQRTLACEIDLLRAKRKRGAPVPELVLAGDDFMVTRDTGRDMAALVCDAPEDPAFPARMAAVGRALAGLHHRGVAHGRPYLRDICWQEATGRVSFIDVERGARLDASTDRFARDVGLLVLSIYALCPDRRGAVLAEACLDAYFDAAPDGMRAACARFARRWRWVAILTAPARWHEARFRQDRRWKEYMAAPLTLAHLRGR